VLSAALELQPIILSQSSLAGPGSEIRVWLMVTSDRLQDNPLDNVSISPSCCRCPPCSLQSLALRFDSITCHSSTSKATLGMVTRDVGVFAPCICVSISVHPLTDSSKPNTHKEEKQAHILSFRCSFTAVEKPSKAHFSTALCMQKGL